MLRHLVGDVAALVWVLPSVEVGRRTRGPLPLIAQLRQRGRDALPRGLKRQTRMSRFISLADRLMPGGPNCYRRVLLQIRLDREAAERPVHFGLMAHGALGSGHAWLAGDRGVRTRYDVEFVL